MLNKWVKQNPEDSKCSKILQQRKEEEEKGGQR